MDPLQVVIWIAVAIGLTAIPLVPPLLVLRGERYWAPWTMLGAVVFFGLTLFLSIGLEFYYIKKTDALMQAGGVSNTYGASSEWERLTDWMLIVYLVGAGLMVLAFLFYTMGLFGVASRWKGAFHRAKELEARTAELASLRDSGLG